MAGCSASFTGQGVAQRTQLQAKVQVFWGSGYRWQEQGGAFDCGNLPFPVGATRKHGRHLREFSLAWGSAVGS